MTNNPQNLSDEEIVQLIKEGDTGLFRILYDKYCGYIKYILNEKANVSNRMYNPEDLLSEVMIKIFENIGRFQPQKASFKTWIVTIATNHALDVVRKKQLTVISYDSTDNEEKSAPLYERVPSKETSPFRQIQQIF